jgi:5-methylcytosine-specific restriction enzyme A
MPDDPFYRSALWLRRRQAVIQRDGGRCVVPGCGAKAVVVDHIVSRRNGGSNLLSNLRCLCPEHDNQIKERPDGKRRNGGKAFVRGCDADGLPTDPKHHWR